MSLRAWHTGSAGGRNYRRLLPALFCVAAGLLMAASAWGSNETDNSGRSDGHDAIQIDHVLPDPRGGRAYRLTYVVPVDMEVYWRFKTDFDNDFLLENRFIRHHRLVSRSGDTVITETRYTNDPDALFRWETTVLEAFHRLTFLLVNPEQCGHRFHYGHIQLTATPEGTRVTQVAYFDFLGVSLWAGYPWKGGMRDLLKYTAQWERSTVIRLKNRYRITDR